MKFNGDIIIADPMGIDTAWNKLNRGNSIYGNGHTDVCDYYQSKNMQKLGLHNYLVSSVNRSNKRCVVLENCASSYSLLGELNNAYFSFIEEYNSLLPIEDKKSCMGSYKEIVKKLESVYPTLGNILSYSDKIGVFLLKDFCACLPDFNLDIVSRYIIIKDFNGEIDILRKPCYNNIDEEISIIGNGNINFFTTQIGF